MDMQVKDKHKQTELGKIPMDWEVKSMNQLCIRIVVGIASSTSAYYTSSNNGVPIIRNQNIKENRLDLTEVLYITKEFDLANKKKRLLKGDILTVRTGYPGITAVVTMNEESYQSFTTLISTPDKEKVDSNFLAYYMNSPRGKQNLTDLSSGGAQQNLNVSSLESFKVVVPPIKEQQKIAEILSSADEQMEKTEQLIEKTKELKKGLMQQLLTKGIGHTEFMQTKLGEIPIEWDIKTIGSLTGFIGSGVTPKGGSTVYRSEGTIFIRSQNVHFIGMKLKDVAFISSEIDEKMRRTRVFENDVLLNITGASIGRCTVVPTGFPSANVNQHVCIIRTKKEMCPYFLNYYLSSEFGQQQIFKQQLGQTREGLNFQQIRNFHIIVPTFKEQRKIAEILSAVDEQIGIYEKEKIKQIELKKALMQQLLTGKLRVTV